jgi:hypothetical protein
VEHVKRKQRADKAAEAHRSLRARPKGLRSARKHLHLVYLHRLLGCVGTIKSYKIAFHELVVRSSIQGGWLAFFGLGAATRNYPQWETKKCHDNTTIY